MVLHLHFPLSAFLCAGLLARPESNVTAIPGDNTDCENTVFPIA